NNIESLDLPKTAQFNTLIELGRTILGITLLALGGRWLVIGATNIAIAFNVSDLIIGVTVVAVGTSLPELATSITAALKGESDIAVGNVIGSYIANLLLVLDGTATIAAIDVGSSDSSVLEYVVVIAFSIAILLSTRNRVLS